MGLTKKSTRCPCEDIPSLEQQLDEIMSCFDFKHVHMMMEWDKSRVEYDDDHVHYHQWIMYNYEDGFCRVPTIEELKKEARRLLEEIIRLHKANPRRALLFIRTGPFKASYREGILELDCIFEDWSHD